MPAYLVVELDVKDPEKFARYREIVPATFTPYGGRYVVRGGKVETLEGDWTPPRLVIVEFPSVAKAKAWIDSAEYAEAKALRHESANTKIIVVEGV